MLTAVGQVQCQGVVRGAPLSKGGGVALLPRSHRNRLLLRFLLPCLSGQRATP
jgi:hypothetical protein